MARRAVSAARPPTRSARGRPTAHAPGGRPARRHYYRRRQTTDDRRQTTASKTTRFKSFVFTFLHLCTSTLQSVFTENVFPSLRNDVMVLNKESHEVLYSQDKISKVYIFFIINY